MSFADKIIKQVCAENGISIESFCDNYCLKLEKNGKSTFVYNNIFESNSSAVYKIMKDKSAVYEILTKNNIPAVCHTYFMPKSADDVDFLSQLKLDFEKYKKVVLKYNEGMSGNDVYFVDNYNDLITISKELISKYNAFSLSPFFDIQHEYRVVVLNGKVLLVFDKIRPFVTGDGSRTVLELANQKYDNKINIDKNIDINLILKQGENLVLSWRHNLNYGSFPKIVTDKTILEKLKQIALLTEKALKTNFASIDIIDDGKSLQVLEVNGSVTLGKFASFSNENYEIAKHIYTEAILNLLK